MFFLSIYNLIFLITPTVILIVNVKKLTTQSCIIDEHLKILLSERVDKTNLNNTLSGYYKNLYFLLALERSISVKYFFLNLTLIGVISKYSPSDIVSKPASMESSL